MAAFASQNVVGAAGGACVHGFQAHALGHQRLQPCGLWKAKARTRAENNQFGVKFSQFCKMRRRQVFKSAALPVQPLAFGAKNHAVGNFFALVIVCQGPTHSDLTDTP